MVECPLTYKVVVGSNLVTFTETSDIAAASSKYFQDILPKIRVCIHSESCT